MLIPEWQDSVTGRFSGLCTYRKIACRTTVNYFIASSGLFEQAVKLFVVNGSALHCNTDSDHYPIRLKLNANEVMQAEVLPEPAVRVKWDSAKKGEFATVLQDELQIKLGPNLWRA